MLGIHVDVARHVEGEQLVLGVVAEHAHQRGVGRHELAVRRRLEDACRDVLEELAVPLLRGPEREQRVRALGRVAQHLVDQMRRDLVLAQEVERAALEHVVADVLVMVADQRDDRDVGRLGLDAQEGRGALAVGQVQVQQDRVEPALLEAGETVGQASDDLEPVRLAVDGFQRSPYLRLLAGRCTDQQNGNGRHRGRVYVE